MKRKIYVASSWRNEYYPKAVRQFHNDIKAMEACDACVLVCPAAGVRIRRRAGLQGVARRR